jgi:hypothetical protein
MSEQTMEKFRCWSGESVGQTVFSDIGALASDADAIFLAAHTPVALDHKKGPEVDDQSSGEAQVLSALLGRVGDGERNTLVAVTGGSGSGKSHVVRWVNAHVDREDERFRVLYVPRAVQTLRALLHRIVEGLPGVEGTDLLQRVDAAIGKASPGELKDRVVSEMRIALNWTIQPRPPEDDETEDEAAAREDRNSLLGEPDEQGRRRDGLADLLEEPSISRALLREGGGLDQLVRSYFNETSRRGDREETFTSDDLPIRERGIRRALQNRPGLQELWDIVGNAPKDTMSLLEEALRAALPATIGLRSQTGGDTLGGLFAASRKALKEQGRELVLIFEDLAQFGLVDGELYDQFVTPPSPDLAPLRVVFAVTDGAYRNLERTVRTRVEHEFQVGGSALADPGRFIGRYLNLIRVGRSRTQQLWSDGGSADIGPWMENACLTLNDGQPCQFLDTCHASFGKVEIGGIGAVGLYPYNAIALRRSVKHFGADATPRLVLDQCLSTNLLEADVHIADGDYPHPRVFDQFDHTARMVKEVVVFDVPPADADRVYLARLIWGDEQLLPSGIEDAFSLPKAKATPEPTPEPEPDPQPRPPAAESPLEPLLQWQNEGNLSVAERKGLPEDEVNTFRQTLLMLTLSRLQLDQNLVHVFSGRGRELLARLFNQTSFNIEGARGGRAGEGSVRIEIKRTPENVRLLAAARWFRDHGHFDPEQGKWPWPTGLDPQQLLLELENALDTWASQVRKRFLEISGGAEVARNALGLRALALAAVGHDVAALTSTSAVLSAPGAQVNLPGASWAAVDLAAQAAFAVPTEEYVAEFAAVRQGSTGDAQLVNILDLDSALSAFFADPAASLARVAGFDADPTLAVAARNLLAAMTAAADAERGELTAAAARLGELLEGFPPEVVGKRALTIGTTANSGGLFRPTDQWPQFVNEVDVLTDVRRAVHTVTVGAGLVGILQAQHHGRDVRRLDAALAFVASAMDATKAECRRSGGAAGDIVTLRDAVKAQVVEIDGLVQTLARKD